jgi:hypothetical protein
MLPVRPTHSAPSSWILAVSIILSLVSTRADADGLYSIQDLGPNVSDLHLNASGQVVGVSSTPSGSQTFLYSNGQFLQPVPNVANPLYLTANGQAIDGYSGPSDFNANGDFAPNPPVAANASGQMIGTAVNIGGSFPYGWFKTGYLYTPGRGLSSGTHEIGMGIETYPNAINNAGTVAGAFLTTTQTNVGGVPTTNWFVQAFRGNQVLGNLPGDTWTVVYGINQKGDVVGDSGPGAGSYSPHAFFAGPDGKLIPLNTFPSGPYNPGWSVAARALNDQDQIVGSTMLAGFPQNTTLAFLYNLKSATMQDLNQLLPQPHSGWLLTDAVDINDAGQIVGYGTLNGVEHGYLLTPIQPQPAPEPTPLALLGLVLIGRLVGRLRGSIAFGRAVLVKIPECHPPRTTRRS